MKSRILVTGGAGYIGSALVAALIQRGDSVTVLDDLWFGGESLLSFLSFDAFRLIKCDLCADGLPGDVMNGVDCVVHLAAIVGFPACEKARREFVWHNNVRGTQRVFEMAKKSGVKRIIFASSYSSYGESRDGDPVTEEHRCIPNLFMLSPRLKRNDFS